MTEYDFLFVVLLVVAFYVFVYSLALLWAAFSFLFNTTVRHFLRKL